MPLPVWSAASGTFAIPVLLHRVLNGMNTMKIRNSLKSAKNRDKNCVIVRRKGRVYVINKRNPRFKARQG